MSMSAMKKTNEIDTLKTILTRQDSSSTALYNIVEKLTNLALELQTSDPLLAEKILDQAEGVFTNAKVIREGVKETVTAIQDAR